MTEEGRKARWEKGKEGEKEEEKEGGREKITLKKLQESWVGSTQNPGSYLSSGIKSKGWYTAR